MFSARSSTGVSCLDAVPLTQFYVWIGTLLDSHLYDIIFYAKKDPQLMQYLSLFFSLLLHRLLHDLDNYVNEYKALSDTCYNVRAILTHIEYVSPPLPLIDFIEKRSLSPCLRFQSTPLRKFLSKGSNVLLRSPCSFSVWILLWLFDFVCLFIVFSPLY